MSLDDPELVAAEYGESIRRCSGSMISEKAKAAKVPDDIGSVRAGRRVTVFVADKA